MCKDQFVHVFGFYFEFYFFFVISLLETLGQVKVFILIGLVYPSAQVYSKTFNSSSLSSQDFYFKKEGTSGKGEAFNLK